MTDKIKNIKKGNVVKDTKRNGSIVIFVTKVKSSHIKGVVLSSPNNMFSIGYRIDKYITSNIKVISKSLEKYLKKTAKKFKKTQTAHTEEFHNSITKQKLAGDLVGKSKNKYFNKTLEDIINPQVYTFDIETRSTTGEDAIYYIGTPRMGKSYNFSNCFDHVSIMQRMNRLRNLDENPIDTKSISEEIDKNLKRFDKDMENLIKKDAITITRENNGSLVNQVEAGLDKVVEINFENLYPPPFGTGKSFPFITGQPLQPNTGEAFKSLIEYAFEQRVAAKKRLAQIELLKNSKIKIESPQHFRLVEKALMDLGFYWFEKEKHLKAHEAVTERIHSITIDKGMQIMWDSAHKFLESEDTELVFNETTEVFEAPVPPKKDMSNPVFNRYSSLMNQLKNQSPIWNSDGSINWEEVTKEANKNKH